MAASTTTDRRALAIETDTKLADLAAEQAKIEVSLGYEMDALHRAVGDEKKHRFSGPWKMTDAEVLNFDSSTLTETPWKIREFEDAHAKHHDLLVKREQIEIEMGDLNEVWAEAGYWHRYFLVDNTNGHVHREMSCSTCYPTTQYRWLVGLADCDEAAMVAEYGEMACTVCFPEAPAMKGYGDGTSGLARYSAEEKAQRAAEKAAKQAAKDAKESEEAEVIQSTCNRKLRGGGVCSMEANHRGRCASVTFDCDGCGKTRRGSPSSQSKVVLGDGTVDDVFDFCFMCSVVEPSQPGYGYGP